MVLDLQKLRDLYAKAEATSKVLDVKYTTPNLDAFGRANSEFGDAVYEAFPALLWKLEVAEAKAAVSGGEWCMENRAEGRNKCMACAVCCKELQTKVEAMLKVINEFSNHKDRCHWDGVTCKCGYSEAMIPVSL